MKNQDNGVLAQFGELLEELTRCGGAEAQSLLRAQLHDLYKAMSPSQREQAQEENSDNSFIKNGLILFVDSSSPQSPPSTAPNPQLAQ